MTEARKRRGLLLRLGGIAILWCAFLNLPWFPTYERGLFTGLGLALSAWAATWIIWVQGGLGFRLNGIWAEDAVVDATRNHDRALAVVSSYKIAGRDIDCVLISAAAVYAVEVKWKNRPPSSGEWRGMTAQLARDMDKLRGEVSSRGVPDRLVRGLLVICGPGSEGLASRLVWHSDKGIRALASDDLDRWLDGQNRGTIGQDFAQSLARQLTDQAAAADRDLGLSRPMRWLARAR